MSPVLLDTGPIVALLDRSERYHQQCVEAVSSLRDPLVTCEAVLSEACYLVRNLRGAAADILNDVHRGLYLVPYSLTDRASRVRKLMIKYADVPMGFADACLVDLASELQTGRILTLDEDFQFYRWSRNRPFEMVLNL